MDKLNLLQGDLVVWATSIKNKRSHLKESLTRKLEKLVDWDRNDGTIAELVDAKVKLKLRD